MYSMFLFKNLFLYIYKLQCLAPLFEKKKNSCDGCGVMLSICYDNEWTLARNHL